METMSNLSFSERFVTDNYLAEALFQGKIHIIPLCYIALINVYNS